MSDSATTRPTNRDRLETRPSPPDSRPGLPFAGALLLFAVALIGGCGLFGGVEDDEQAGQLEDLRAATAPFHSVDAAQAAGYDLVAGLDHCFTNPPTGDMGFHYIDAARLDLTLDPLRPEAMVYAPREDGTLQLGAVEFIVPAEAWNEAGHEGVPRVLGHGLHLNDALGVYVLHAWIWIDNPAGMFEDWNPEVRCP